VGDIIKESAGGHGRDWGPVGDIIKESAGGPGSDWDTVGDSLKSHQVDMEGTGVQWVIVSRVSRWTWKGLGSSG